MRGAGGLFEKITAFENLLLAAKKALRGKRGKPRPAEFFFHLEQEIGKMKEEITSGAYRPLPHRSFEVFHPKHRVIRASDFRDRVVHHAICNYLEPVLDRGMIFHTYACRTGKGTHAAVKRANVFSRRYPFFLKCDVRKYFDSIDHEVLKAILARRVKDERLSELLAVIIDQPVEGLAPGKGLPIGNLTSQVFANVYLGELDHLVKERLRFKGYLRYMDDLLFFADEKGELHLILEESSRFLREKLYLTLKEKATILAPVTEGIAFVAFRIFPGLVRVDTRTLSRMRRAIRAREKAFCAGEIEEDALSRSVGSMMAHLAHADTIMAGRRIFEASIISG